VAPRIRHDCDGSRFAAPAKSLLDQSPWWIVPSIGIVLLLVLAMMECTRTLLVKPAPQNLEPVDAGELRRRLLALKCPAEALSGLSTASAGIWSSTGMLSPHRGRDTRPGSKMTALYRARMLLDGSRHEMRWFEFVRGSNFFIRFLRLVPVLRCPGGCSRLRRSGVGPERRTRCSRGSRRESDGFTDSV